MLSTFIIITIYIMAQTISPIQAHQDDVKHAEYTTDMFFDHPLVNKVKDVTDNASTMFPQEFDATKFWMNKFITEVIKPSKLSTIGTTYDGLLSNIQRLAEYDHKGWLREVARGNIPANNLMFPKEDLRPLLIRGYMPVVTPDDPLPIITLEQEIGDVKVINQFPFGDASQKKRQISQDTTEARQQIQETVRNEFNTKFGQYPHENTAVYVTAIKVDKAQFT